MTMTTQRLTVPDVLPLVRAYVSRPENSVGGSLHVVLEDHNIKDSDVQHCLDYALEHEDPDGVALARMLLQLSKTQRLRLAHMCWTD